MQTLCMKPYCPKCEKDASSVRFITGSSGTQPYAMCIDCGYKGMYSEFFMNISEKELPGFQLIRSIEKHFAKSITDLFFRLSEEDQDIIFKLMERLSEKVKDHN